MSSWLHVSLLLLGFTVSGVLATASDGVKIAVLDKDGSSQAEALMVTALTAQKTVNVLERAELWEIVAEQKLRALMVSGEFRALGELAGADGLLLETLTVKNGEKFRLAQLLATNSGACLFAEKIPADGGLVTWSAVVAAWVANRATALRSRTLPVAAVAVLNLRSVSGSARDLELERTATRLLEFGLGKQEKFILLERRSLADVMFEKTLNATDALPLLASQILLDGSIEPDDGKTVTLKLRLRRAADGDATTTTLTVSPIPADAKSIAEAALQKLLADFNLPAGSVTISGEADEFMWEALWAWRAQQWHTCREAPNSAETLGGKAADIYLVRAKTVDRFIHDNQQNNDFMKNRRADLLKDAVRDLQNYRHTDGELKYFPADYHKNQPYFSMDSFSFERVRYQILTHIHDLLQAHDRDGSHVLDDLRRQTREFLGTKDGTFAEDSEYPADFALNYQELLAYAEQIISTSLELPNSRQRIQLRIKLGIQLRMMARENILGLRFAQNEAARQACQEMLKRREHDARLKGRVMLVRAGNAKTPEEQAAYREFLQYLAANCVELYNTGELKFLLETDDKSHERRRLFHRERSELLISLLENLPDFEFAIEYLQVPEFPADLRDRANTAFARYHQVCLAVPGKTAAQQSLLIQNLANLAGRNGLNPPATDQSGAPELKITRFWRPYQMLELNIKHLLTDEVIVSGNTVWYPSIEGYRRYVFQIDLPTLTTTIHTIPESSRWLVPADGKFYMYNSDNNKVRKSLLCYDLATKTATLHEVAGAGRPLVFNNRVFFMTDEGAGRGGALWEWQPQEDSFKLWFSARRKPAETPLDERPTNECPGIIHGFNDEPLLVMNNDGGEIRRLGGDWEIITELYRPAPTNYGDESLLESRGDVLLTGRQYNEPAWLIQESRSKKTNPQPTVFGWKIPNRAKFRPDSTNMAMKNYAYHAGSLFRLERDSADNYYLRWWQANQPGFGVQISLTFAMPEEDAKIIVPIVSVKPFLCNAEETLFPEKHHSFLHLHAADSGLVLTANEHGFWFIPYEDLAKFEE
ncbi:MAG: hypothetical protein LBK60_01925 [Verrucomicrobiales bacterium]|nr:hypothetical protein [Verrucomicrobiales bacterium]